MGTTPLLPWWPQVWGETAPRLLLVWCFLGEYPAVTGYDQTAEKKWQTQMTQIKKKQKKTKQKNKTKILVTEGRSVVTLRPYKLW